MFRHHLRSGLGAAVKAFPKTAARAAAFISSQLHPGKSSNSKIAKQKRTIANKQQKISAQAEKIGRQNKALEHLKNRVEAWKKRVEAYKNKTSSYKDRIDLYKNKIETQKREISGLAHALYTLPAYPGRPRQGEDPRTSLTVADASSQFRDDFERDGFIGPLRLFTAAECRLIADHLRERTSPAPAEWSKGRAVTDYFWYELGTRPKLISLLNALMGDDIVLWGSTLVKRAPGQPHPWHTDIESSDPDGGFVSVWIGLENTCRESGLQLVTRSHMFGKSIQEVCHKKGAPRGTASSESVFDWARELDEDAQLLQPEVRDGEALIFDGRMWHGSHNSLQQTRLALLLQYARADRPVRIRDPKQLEWPFLFLQNPLPPVVAVSGVGDGNINRLTAPPTSADGTCSILVCGTHPIPLPLPEKKEKGWRSHHVFRGVTPILDFLGCHVSILSSGSCPHAPHAHAEEELLIVLDGEADLIISASPELEGARVERVREGDFAYYSPYQHHTIRNPGGAPVTYLMFKWRGVFLGPNQPLGAKLFHYDLIPDEEKPRWSQHLFEVATPYLGRLASHVTVLQPDEGYEQHVDPYDVTILLFIGTVHTIGRTVTAPSVICYPAGEPHGIINVGADPARYLVFEFHADHLGKKA